MAFAAGDRDETVVFPISRHVDNGYSRCAQFSQIHFITIYQCVCVKERNRKSSKTSEFVSLYVQLDVVVKN